MVIVFQLCEWLSMIFVIHAQKDMSNEEIQYVLSNGNDNNSSGRYKYQQNEKKLRKFF